MADLRITESIDAGSVTNAERLPVAQPSTTVTLTATTISASSIGNVLTDSGGGWITAGFVANSQVRISGFTGGGTANNITSATVVSLSATELYLDVTLTTVAAGDSVTVTRWVPRKITPDALVAGSTAAATGKTTPVDADALPIIDSAASNGLKKVTWANIKATLKTYTDTLYALTGAVTGSGLTMATGKLLGRSTASTGAIEEITVGSGLSLSAGTLSASGGSVDASAVTYTPADTTDWNSSADPGNVDDGLDQLADRTKTIEGKIVWDAHAFYPGVPTASAIIVRIPSARAVNFAANFSGSYGVASVAATASTAFDVTKNGSTIGTITFAISATTATFTTSGGAAQTLAAGDVLAIVAPGTPDATLANVGFALAGTR